MDNWEELKTTYTVGMLGTVTAASEALNVHRATVIRHIDSLEGKLGQNLFIRHTNGYTPTEACEELIQVVKTVNEQFQGLSGRLKGHSELISGEFIVTSLDAFAPILLPVIKKFQQKYEEVKTTFIASEQVLRLEYGEAHVALRPGPKPKAPDNKVIPYGHLKFGLFATKEYIQKYGMPKDIDDLKKHRFICRHSKPKANFENWIKENIPPENIVLRGTTPFICYQGVMNHIGVGFLPYFVQEEHANLVELLPAHDEWHIPLWIVIHRDMWPTAKVKAFLKLLKKSDSFKKS